MLLEIIIFIVVLFGAIFNNSVLWPCIFSWMVAQVIKIIINLIVQKKFDISRLWGDGGMPSGHSATVAALATICGWGYGFSNALFGVAMILMIIVTHDAVGVRREAGKHAVSIKLIAETINHLINDKDDEIRTEKLKELVGHTPLQVFFGCLVGVLVTIVYCAIRGIGYESLYIAEIAQIIKAF
ncbi:MAG: divergent PAP2 family protein [Clostridia bacterium]|nr:divergent PAP2 family protein [Clostridia bacterium]